LLPLRRRAGTARACLGVGGWLGQRADGLNQEVVARAVRLSAPAYATRTLRGRGVWFCPFFAHIGVRHCIQVPFRVRVRQIQHPSRGVLRPAAAPPPYVIAPPHHDREGWEREGHVVVLPVQKAEEVGQRRRYPARRRIDEESLAVGKGNGSRIWQTMEPRPRLASVPACGALPRPVCGVGARGKAPGAGTALPQEVEEAPLGSSAKIRRRC
jgi:hypothetical protein